MNIKQIIETLEEYKTKGGVSEFKEVLVRANNELHGIYEISLVILPDLEISAVLLDIYE